jgi:transcription elongation GreA/GreB family factor
MNKEQIVEACFSILNQKIDQVNLAIQDANQSLHDDTKSSAGDKYETSREMIQQDLNRFEQQLKVLNQDAVILNRIKTQKAESNKAGLGSVIQTDKAIYFLATSIGLVSVGDQKIFSISTASPIGKALVGKALGESFEFNGAKQVIKGLY